MAQIIITIIATFLFLSLSPLSITAGPTAVLDTNGRPLRVDSTYYIFPVVQGQGGSLTMTPKNATKPCPLNVAQQKCEVSNGLPNKFFPANPKQRTVFDSTDLNIVFDAATTCVQSTVWTLTFDEATRTQYLETGGVIGNPGADTLGNWFHIWKSESGMYDYKISFCPAVCPACTMMCGHIGVLTKKDGTRFLGLTDQPLLVRFKKV